MVSCFVRGGDGVSAYRAAYDRGYTQELVPFGETVLYKEPAPAHRGLRGNTRATRLGIVALVLVAMSLVARTS